jgi:hypothetical protein
MNDRYEIGGEKPSTVVPGDYTYSADTYVHVETPEPFTRPQQRNLRVDASGDPIEYQPGEAYVREVRFSIPDSGGYRHFFEVRKGIKKGEYDILHATFDRPEKAVEFAAGMNRAAGITPVRPSREGVLRAELDRIDKERVELNLAFELVASELAIETGEPTVVETYRPATDVPRTPAGLCPERVALSRIAAALSDRARALEGFGAAGPIGDPTLFAEADTALRLVRREIDALDSTAE